LDYTRQRIVTALEEIARKYPADQVAAQLSDVSRMAFNIEILAPHLPPKACICDVGGGIGIFTPGCAALEMRATLIDDFRDPVNETYGEKSLDLLRSLGVTVVQRDVVAEGFDYPADSFDAVTCFESLEHWHGSPKRALHAMVQSLKSGGVLAISGPNCVNLRKRITVPLGRGKWSSLDSWYNSPVFRGHVREPDVDDLRSIAFDLGLRNVKIVGRNWVGYSSPKRLIRLATSVFDRGLRALPSLCANIYMIGTKP
jgi:2-polyprenyl-3-methyl-5-hydroxy-6-metoxy-1,4-benzoquinol methylase